MLVALLSSLEPAGNGASCPRAFLRVAGQSVIERQADLALALGSERIVCFGSGLTPELLAVQHKVERQGQRFHLLRTVDALRGQVAAADELLVLADGIVPDHDVLAQALGSQRGVVAFPAEQGLAAGFERMDRELAWAGALRCGGAELERIADLPHDIDPLSALMRAALQAGRKATLLPPDVLADGRWPLVSDAQQARQVGRRILSLAATPERWFAPAYAMIDRMVRANAERLLHGNFPAAVLPGLAAFCALGGLVAAGSGFLVSAFMLIALAAALLRSWTSFARLRGVNQTGRTNLASSVGIDLVLLGAVVAHSGLAAWSALLFPMLMAVASLHLLAVAGPQGLRPLGRDKVVLSLILALGAWQDVLGPAMQIIAFAALGACLIAHRPARLTGA